MNLLRDLPAPQPDEIVETLATGNAVRIERIFSHGQASPDGFWYDQDEAEFVVLLAGAARFRFADEETPRSLAPGDTVEIEAHRRHRVEWTAPTTPTAWLAVFFQPGHSGRSEAKSRNP